MVRTYSHAVYIGRFQPVHNAHLESIRRTLEKADRLLLFIGSANRVETVRNPWSFRERESFLRDAICEYFGEPLRSERNDLPDESILNRITFLPLRDYLYNDYKWLSEVYAKAVAHGAGEGENTLLVGCDKDDSSYYLRMFPRWTLELIPYLYDLDSTDIRRHLFEGETITGETVQPSTERFLNGWIGSAGSERLCEEYFYYRDYLKSWESAPYTPIFTTVDALVIKSGCLLLIRRGFQPGKGLWALPGGFLNPDEHIIDSMVRELKEETRIRVPKGELREGVRDVRVFDHPRRSLRGRIITHAHLVDLGIGPLPEVKAASDASGAHWVPLADVMQQESQFFEDHFDIIVNMVSRY